MRKSRSESTTSRRHGPSSRVVGALGISASITKTNQSNRNAQKKGRAYLFFRMDESKRVKRESSQPAARDGLGIVPTNFAVRGPSKTVPRVDYERIFVLDEEANLLGEYVLRDDCPLEFDDLRHCIPVDGMRHLRSMYRGEYAFTPFRVENLWFVVLSRGVPRIEERGSIGTLLAAMRVHLPASLSAALAAREASLADRERAMETRETRMSGRADQIANQEADLEVARTKLDELETEVRSRETRLNLLRDYAVQMQESLQPDEPKPKSRGELPEKRVP